jgi:hypothetical protein
MIHSVFRNSVKNGGTERATTITICNIFARSKFCSQLYCGYLAWSTAALKSSRNSRSSRIMSSACLTSSCVVRLFKVTLDANTPTQHVTVDDRPAPVLMQRATAREELEAYGNSSPIMHSVFHNSVENQALENGARVLSGATFRGKCCGNSCGSSGKITGGLLNHRRIMKGLMVLDSGVSLHIPPSFPPASVSCAI